VTGVQTCALPIFVNSVSSPATDWDAREEPPNTINILLKSTGVPIDHFSYEAVELLKDMSARWKTARMVRQSEAFRNNKDPAVAKALNAPDAEIYAIDVSFQDLDDQAEVDYLNSQPTSFVLTDEAVDRLRAAAGNIIRASPEFKRLLKDAGATITLPPAAGISPTGAGSSSAPAAK